MLDKIAEIRADYDDRMEVERAVSTDLEKMR